MTYPQQPGGQYGPPDPNQGYPQQQPPGYPQPQPGYGQPAPAGPGFAMNKPNLPSSVNLAMLGLFGMAALTLLQMIVGFIGTNLSRAVVGISWFSLVMNLLLAGMCAVAGFLVMSRRTDLARSAGLLATGAITWVGLANIFSVFGSLINGLGRYLTWTTWLSVLVALVTAAAGVLVALQLLQPATREHFNQASAVPNPLGSLPNPGMQAGPMNPPQGPANPPQGPANPPQGPMNPPQGPMG